MHPSEDAVSVDTVDVTVSALVAAVSPPSPATGAAVLRSGSSADCLGSGL